MADTSSTTSFRADISQLKAAMQQAQRQVRLASSEFQAATAGLDNWSNSAVGLSAKITQLEKTLDAQKKKVALAREEWEKTTKEYGENSAEADRAKIKLNSYEAAVAKTEKELEQYEGELKDCQNETGRFAKEIENADDAAQEAAQGFTVMKGAIADLVANAIRGAISALKDLAKAALEAGMNFESEMSKVKAISGATSEDMEKLTEKAKQMGETTVFSASEAASAFEYMAMAGWKTEDMLGGIEGIMNLAAASGEDLSITSDIVTDALTAFGMEASEAGRLADVMAAASSNANTNVSMLGESFKYVAPLAGSMGYSAEDVATALGLMANSGVKASSAGTALRTMLTNMAKPTDQMAEAMEKLGVRLDDGAGNMKSLQDIMKDLRQGFKGLKGNTEEFQKKYESLTDDFEQGIITEKEYNELVEDLTKSTFGAEGALKAEAAAMLAGKQGLSGLMAIVNASDEDFNKLTKAINDSNGAAQGMAETMNDNLGGQITLLKSKVEGIMIKVFEKASGHIRSALDTISQALDNIDWDAVAEAIGNLVKKAAEFVAWALRNADVIIEVIKSIAKVMATLWAVKKISQFAQAINGVITIVKGFAAAIKGAEAATTAMNASSGILASLVSPGGAIVLGIAAVIAVTASLISIFSEEKRQIDVLTQAQKESIDASWKLKESYDAMDVSRRSNMATVNNEFAYYQELLREFDSIVSANGEVKAGYEDRAAFIMTTLNEALGMEMTMQDGIIENYAKERQAINQQIEAKKAELILQANEEAYAQAIQGKTEATQTYLKAQETFNDVMKAAEEQAVKVEQVYMEMARIEAEDGVHAAKEYQDAHQEVFDTYQQLQVEVTNTRAALSAATEAYEGYNQTIENYEGLSAAIIGGDSKKINDSLLLVENGFKTHTNTTADQLKKQRDAYDDNYKRLKKAIEEGDNSVTQQMVDDAKALADKAQAEYLKSGQQTVAGYSKGLKDSSHYAEEAAKQMGYDSYADFNESLGIKSPSTKTYSSGEYFAQGFVNGMDSKSSVIYQKAKQLAQKAIQGLKDGQKEGSPSKITTQSGKYFTQGFINGIGSLSKDVITAAKKVVTGALEALESPGVLQGVKVSAAEVMEAAAVPLSLGNVSGARAAIYSPASSGAGAGRGSTVNNNTYNLVQNNTSPKALTALETYQARRQQVAMLKAMM